MADTDYSTLEKIRIKIRRLTRTPSTAQMSNATLDEYINSFILYDFPEHIRLDTLRKTYSFNVTPYIDAYTLDDIATNLINEVNNVYAPIYVAGEKQFLSQNREEFYNLWPQTKSVKALPNTLGDGITTNFTGTLSSKPILREQVAFLSLGANDVRLAIYDVPNDPNDGAGTFTGDTGAAGSINYVTGVYNITFSSAPADGEYIYSETLPYAAGKPTTVLYYNNTFTFRPVPDKAYTVSFEYDARPTELVAGAMPELAQWSDYVAYGAAKKIFEDRMDMDSVQMIMPEFKKQETLVNRRTIAQQSQQRSATIYSDMSTGLNDYFNK